MLRDFRTHVLIPLASALVCAGLLILVGCEGTSSNPVAPDADEAPALAYAPKKCESPPCGGGGNDDPPSSTTLTLSGGMVATDQQVVIDKDNKREFKLSSVGGTFVSELNFVTTHTAGWNAPDCSTSDNFDELGLISRDDLFALILDKSGNDGTGLRGQGTPGLHMRITWLDPAMGNFVTDWHWQEHGANVKLFVHDSAINPTTQPNERIPGAYEHAAGGTLEIRYHPSGTASSNTVSISCPNRDAITATLQ